MYDFHRLVKVRKFAERYERSNINSDRRFHKNLRSPLEIGGKTYEMDILKVKRSKSVDIFEFFFHYLKKKDLFLFSCLIPMTNAVHMSFFSILLFQIQQLLKILR